VEKLMDCTQAQMLLNAWLDGELTSSHDSAALEAHLDSCSECRASADFLRLQDGDLRRAFAPARESASHIATNVISALDPPLPVVPRRATWQLLLAATVAGYLLAIFTWRPAAEDEHAGLRPMPPVARLALATGPVEFKPPKELGWFTCPANTELEQGAAVRTESGTRCEVSTGDGSQVRLNGDSQAHFHGTRQVTLERGQLWSQVAGGEAPFCVTAPDAKVLAGQGRISMSCEPGQTIVTVVEGSARVESGDEAATLAAGQSAQIVEGRLSEVSRASNTLLATSWINELLAVKGSEDPEFTARMNDILAQLGQTKLSYLYEEEIRRLGDNCVLPIVRFLESSRSQPSEPKRERAAGIVADVAQPRSIPLLIELLADDNPRVRAHAARGLQRLTSRDFGRPPAQWESDSWASCAPTHREWQEWWDKNRDRYPGPVGPQRSGSKDR
jgi:hypothetical protein